LFVCTLKIYEYESRLETVDTENYLFNVPLGFKDGDDSGPEDSQGRDVVGEDTERSGERGNVDLFDCGILKM
jgi:hypothetical protein